MAQSLKLTKALMRRGEEKMKRLRWVWEGDGYLRLTILIAVVASLVSFVHFYSNNLTLLYGDAESHLMIAKRVVGSLTPGLAQLGGVWLPLQHILMLPFIWNDFMYWSGLAGSIVSMVSFVLATVFIYKIALLLTEDKGASLVAAFIFAINPNILYMQSTPMWELLIICSIVATVYYLMKWSQDVNKLQYLFATALAVFLATLTRYENWALLLVVVAVLLYIFIRNHFGYHKIEGHLVYFGALAGFGILLWLVWCQVILGDFLYLSRGEYARIGEFAGEKATGSLYLSGSVYGLTVAKTASVISLLLGAAGLVYFLISTKFKANKIGALVLLFPLLFFVAAIYSGQIPVHIPGIAGTPEGMFNIRYGLVMIPAVALFAGYLTQRGIWLKALVVIGVTVGAVMMVQANDIITLNEPIVARREWEDILRQVVAAEWFRNNYDGGLVLMESKGNEQVAFESRIPMRKFIYEGSYKYWEPALKNPQDLARWVFMRGGATPDKVWKALHGTPQLLDNYDLVYQNGGIEIYKRKTK